MSLLSNWWVVSILCSVIAAFYFGMNGRFKMDGTALVFWRSLFTVLVMLPFLHLCEWPANYSFYAWSFLMGIFFAFGDIFMFNAIAKHSGSSVSRILPMSTGVQFVLWSIIEPSSFMLLLDPIWKLIGVVVSIIIGLIAISNMSKNPLSLAVIKDTLPAVIFFTIGNIILKYTMDLAPNNSWDAAIITLWILSIAMVPVAGIYGIIFKRGIIYKNRANYLPILLGAILFIMIAATKNAAVGFATNPAYVNTVMSLSVVWLYWYHRIRNIPDNADPKLGLLFVASSVALILFTS